MSECESGNYVKFKNKIKLKKKIFNSKLERAVKHLWQSVIK